VDVFGKLDTILGDLNFLFQVQVALCKFHLLNSRFFACSIFIFSGSQKNETTLLYIQLAEAIFKDTDEEFTVGLRTSTSAHYCLGEKERQHFPVFLWESLDN